MSFHLKHNLLIITLILLLVGIIGLLIQVFIYLFSPPNTSSASFDFNVAPIVASKQNYSEKIDNFSLQSFNPKHQLLHFIEAQQYFNLKDAPALLLQPKVTVYDKTGVEGYFISAKRAHYLDNAELEFIGTVHISTKTGIKHTINTESLLVNTETNDLNTDTAIRYSDTNLKVDAQGMQIQSNGEKIKFKGRTSIKQDNGTELLSKNIYVDRSNAQQRYYAKHNTIYLSKNNKVYATGMDMDARQALLQLLGNVKILQNSGSQIYTKNLLIDQSMGQDIYQTKHKIRYKSKLVDINANGMLYQAKAQKIKLIGGVTGRYNSGF